MFSKRVGSSSAGIQTLIGRPVTNSIRPPAFSRQQHIDSYMKDPQLAPSTRKVADDDSTFDTVFQSVTGDTLILRVYWPAVRTGMVARPPIMTLSGVEARHPWLDSRMCIIGYVPIQSADRWAEAHILLGVAVHTVIQHLQLNPPTIVKFVDSGLVAIQAKKATLPNGSTAAAAANTGYRPSSNGSATPPAYNDSMLPASSAAVTTPAPVIPDVALPTIPHDFPELESLTRDQLEALMMNDLDFRAFYNKLPIMSEYRTIQQKVILENAVMAKQNLASEHELQELMASVERLQTDLRDRVAVFQGLEQKQDSICKPPDKGKVCRELMRLKKESFDKSEKIADQWLETLSAVDARSASTDVFCDEFIAERKVHHTRAAKLELLERNSVA